MINTLSHTQKGILFALIGYSGFAISDASAKFLTDTYPVLLIVAYIMLFTSILLLLAAPVLGGISKPGKGKWKLHALRAAMNFGVSVFIVFAFAQLPLATAYTIVFAKPFLAVMLAIPFYKEHVPLYRWGAIALGFIGIVIAMRPGGGAFDYALLLPLGAALCSAIMWITSRSLEGESVFSMGFYPALGTLLLSIPFIVPIFEVPALSDLVFFLICGIGVSAGVLGLSIAFRAAPSAAISPFHYSQMIWGLALGYLIFGDLPDQWTIMGAIIIIGSGIFLILSERKKR